MAEKLKAFRAFDFEGDAAWNAYRLNLEVPPGKEGLLLKFKAKWYQKNKDPDFDVGLVIGPAGGAAAAPKPESVNPKQAPPRAAAAPPQQQRAQQRDMRQLGLCISHLIIFFSAVVSLQPFHRFYAHRAYFICVRTAAVSLIYQVVRKVGMPRFRPFPAALQGWMTPLAGSSEFFYLLSCIFMIQSPAIWLGVVPVALLSLYHASAFLNANFGQHPLWKKHGLKAHRWLAANQENARRVGAVFDIAVGFQAAVSVLRYGFRAAMLAYVYWNQLRLRFWTPEARPYHLWAWKQLEARARPLLTAVPSLQRYIGMVQRWFEQPMAQQQQRQGHRG